MSDQVRLAEIQHEMLTTPEQPNDLYRICPDCNGDGSISVMSANPDMHETEYECERCQFAGGYIKAEPCEHGNYARHVIPDIDQLGNFDWCDGNPKEDSK